MASPDRDRDLAARRRRQQWIDKFVERQQITRQWISLSKIADWCASSTTTASAAAQEDARTLAWQLLNQSARNGEFERAGRSKILYLDAFATPSGASPCFWLTCEQLAIGHIGSIRDLPGDCYLPRGRARQWFVSHDYRWPTHFDPVPQQPLAPASTIAEHATARLKLKTVDAPPQRPGAQNSPKLRKTIERVIDEHGHPGKNIHWMRFCDLVRGQCGVPRNTRGYGDRTIKRTIGAIERDKSDKSDMSDMSC
jgi:hypothetical protein